MKLFSKTKYFSICPTKFSILDNISAPFEKVDTFKQGLGLGLTLCKSILKHLGSELQIDSEPKHGSTFSFLLK